MKVIHLSYSDIVGGAAVAAYRIHHALLKKNVNSQMWVNKALSDDYTVDDHSDNKPLSKIKKLFTGLRPSLVYNSLAKTVKTNDRVFHSPAILPSTWVKHINNSDADIVNLHWINNEMLSIKDISKIKKPLVWTLYDMWPFSGAEHYTDDTRWREGYYPNNRPTYESGFDLNLWTWRRKKKYWKTPIQIITSSLWLTKCVRESSLMSNWPVSEIAYPIDTETFKPLEKKVAREQLGLPNNIPIILFGAFTGGKYSRKGFDLLLTALKNLKGHPKSKDLQLVIFGQSRPKSTPDLIFPTHYLGHLHDNVSLRVAYSAADVMVIPSRQDTLPLIGIEAQACGIPVVAFDTGGMPDILENKKTGYLARAFDTKDLSNGILWTLDQLKTEKITKNTRLRALNKFSPSMIAEQYQSIYEKVLKVK
jgi:glycosyltransferase involved in cell wall biosynthesis